MKAKALRKIKTSLECALKELTRSKVVDSKLRSRYAEYLVAYELAKKGHKVQLSNERGNKNADICLIDNDNKKRVEVKSGKYKDDGCTAASFGDGRQIKNNKFDYCVFVTFDKSDESIVKEMFVFSREELSEVAEKPREKLAKHPKTNPCLLFRCNNFKRYKEKKDITPQLKIEIDLNKCSRKYNKKWNKIK